MNRDLKELEQIIGYTFKDKGLLKQAMMHSSHANEKRIPKYKNNERLEFLGDAVLELVSSEYLFFNDLTMPEGSLTNLRASMVCEPTLAQCAKNLDLGSFLLLGKGEALSGGRNRSSVTSDALEALIGSLYLDGGFTIAKEFILAFVLSDADRKKLFYDSKTILQEMVQAKHGMTATYVLLAEEGPDHDKTFLVAALVQGEEVGRGQGRTKKAAEKEAAYKGIVHLKELDEKEK